MLGWRLKPGPGSRRGRSGGGDMFSVARLQLENPEKDLGKWDFLAIRINDEPAVLKVNGVIHSPVMWPAISEQKQQVPSVVVVVSLTEFDDMEMRATKLLAQTW